jgi:hypothetical protein
MMTLPRITTMWGNFYWPRFLIAVSLAFALPELYALVTNQANTLSDYSWGELSVQQHEPLLIHTVAWWLSLVAWCLFAVAITAHIWFRKS